MRGPYPQYVYGIGTATTQTFARGVRVADHMPTECNWCGNPSSKQCRDCICTKYCSRECQVAHWPDHKLWCKELNERRKADEANYRMGTFRVSYARARLLDNIANILIRQVGKTAFQLAMTDDPFIGIFDEPENRDTIINANRTIVLMGMINTPIYAAEHDLTLPDFTKLAALQVTPCDNFMKDAWPIMRICLSPMVKLGYIGIGTLMSLRATCSAMRNEKVMRHWWRRSICDSDENKELVQKLVEFPIMFAKSDPMKVMVWLGPAGASQIREYFKQWDYYQWVLYIAETALALDISADPSDFLKLWEEIVLSQEISADKYHVYNNKHRKEYLNNRLYEPLLVLGKESLLSSMIVIGMRHVYQLYRPMESTMFKYDAADIFHEVSISYGAITYSVAELIKNGAVKIIKYILDHPDDFETASFRNALIREKRYYKNLARIYEDADIQAQLTKN